MSEKNECNLPRSQLDDVRKTNEYRNKDLAKVSFVSWCRLSISPFKKVDLKANLHSLSLKHVFSGKMCRDYASETQKPYV